MDTIHKILVPTDDLDLTCINTIRTLSMDAVQAANSGHPGTPMALAPVAYCLWQNFLRFDPQDPIWPNRDRFILSAGHASMLLYSLLHLTGVKAVSWAKYVGARGQTIGMQSFGASAPLRKLTKKFGFTPEHVVAAAREQLQLQATAKGGPP